MNPPARSDSSEAPTQCAAPSRRTVLRALGAAGTALLVPALGAPAARATPLGYPSVKVTDLATAKPYNLAAFNRTKVPTLAWFWAPH